jgi:hypothetical protein
MPQERAVSGNERFFFFFFFLFGVAGFFRRMPFSSSS